MILEGLEGLEGLVRLEENQCLITIILRNWFADVLMLE